MKIRKKPDLLVRIPSYPGDYVEMPPETKRLILEANRTPNDIPYIDDEPEPRNTDPGVMSPTVVKFQDDYRSPTPEVRFADPEGYTFPEVKKSDLEISEGEKEDSPVMYRRQLQRVPLSAPVFGAREFQALQEAYGVRVS